MDVRDLFISNLISKECANSEKEIKQFVYELLHEAGLDLMPQGCDI